MSKHKDSPPLADWEVHLASASTVIIADSWWKRDRSGYTFRDEHGIAYDFPLASVRSVHRAGASPGALAVIHAEVPGTVAAERGWTVALCLCGGTFHAPDGATAKSMLAKHLESPNGAQGHSRAAPPAAPFTYRPTGAVVKIPGHLAEHFIGQRDWSPASEESAAATGNGDYSEAAR